MNETQTRVLQALLTQEGFDPGPIDGDNGPKTRAALVSFDKEFGGQQIIAPSPNVSLSTNKMKGIVWHHSCGSWEGDRSWIQNPKSQVSYHVLISPEGKICYFVPYRYVAWHAGKSVFKGIIGCNTFMVGIAFTGDTNHRSLTDAELKAAKLLHDKLDIERGWQTDHRTVSPGRKDDLHPKQLERLMNHLFA